MEEKIYANELGNHLNQEIYGDYLVSQKELREGTKDFYLRLKLSDKTGTFSANVWNNAKAVSDKFVEGDIVKVKGVVISYKSQIQLTINKLRALSSEEYDLADFIETTSKDVNKLSDRLFGYIDSLKNKDLRSLLTAIYEDKDFYRKFSSSPAAKSWHHNYIGGLLEHTITVTELCDFASRIYPIDRDILLTGALLHDVGKVFEYEVVSAIDFTNAGRLLGHIPMGDEFVCRKAGELNNFPEELLLKIRHLILSHHGEYEKASARLPQTIEAVLLHHVDNLDAQTTGVKQLINNVQMPESEWSEYDRLNNRYYYLK